MKKILIILVLIFVFTFCKRDNTQLYNQACDFEDNQEFDKAIELLSKALEINPKDIECYNNRAWDYYELGQFENAFNDFKEILRIDSLNTAAIYGIGYLKFEQSKYEETLELFNRIIEIKGGPVFLEITDNEFTGQRILEANMEQVFYYKNLAEENLKK